MTAHWDLSRAGYIAEEQRNAAITAGLIPNAREIEAKVKDLVGEGRTPAAVAVQIGPVPPPTADMIERVESRMAREIEEWRSECRRLARVAKEKRAIG